MIWKITWGIWQIFNRALESLKIGTLMGFLVQSWKYMSLKFTEELCIMATKNDAKIEEQWTQFKTDMRHLTNFDPSTQNLKNLHFTRLPLTKIYVWAKKVRRSYVWWNWRLLQNLKESWIWEILTRALESLETETLIGFFYPKLENLWA